MNKLVTFTRERFQHMERCAGPELDFARIADRCECNAPRDPGIELVAVLHFAAAAPELHV
jgi:hypothetical protein